jgi:hypothetical protein
MHIKITNGVIEQYSISRLGVDFPNMSFPKAPPAEILAIVGIYAFTVLDQPPFNEATQIATEGDFTEVDGTWVVPWIIVNKSIADAAVAIRNIRDELLAATDWQAVADRPHMSPRQVGYRNALRAVPNQAGFPFDVVWPDMVSDDLSSLSVAERAYEERMRSAPVSRFSFATALAADGIITIQEAKAFAGGTGLPAFATDVIAASGLTDVQKISAEIKSLSAVSIHRLNPIVLMMQSAKSMTDAEVDTLFAHAATFT